MSALAPTSAEQGVEAMSPEEIATWKRLAEDTRYSAEAIGMRLRNDHRLLLIASDHAAQQWRIKSLEAQLRGTEIRAEAAETDQALLKAENAALRAALGFYAHPDNHNIQHVVGNKRATAVKWDGGKIARAALQPAARPAGDETGGAK